MKIYSNILEYYLSKINPLDHVPRITCWSCRGKGLVSEAVSYYESHDRACEECLGKGTISITMLEAKMNESNAIAEEFNLMQQTINDCVNSIKSKLTKEEIDYFRKHYDRL